jgi:CheY-like chemotaxis protein
MSALAGKRILVVEDEALVAMMLEDMLADLGCEVVGPAMRLDEGLELARLNGLDAAVLDINLGGERSYPIADLLDARGVPLAFVTGYGHSGRPGKADRVLQKPYREPQLRAVLAEMLRPG